MTGPYEAAAWEYRQAGWQGVIPIGRAPAQKSPPPTGYTGWAGIDPSGADIQAWIDGPEGGFNVGLHIPRGVVVIDVDAYHGGDDALAALEARVGAPLPPTFTSTARGPESASRHRFYRAALPEGRTWKDHPGEGIDTLHVGHRYAIVWPSVNPQASGAPYQTYTPDGEPFDGPVPLDALPELPPEWIEELSQDGVPLEGSAAGDAQTFGVLQRFRPGPPCPRVARGLAEELDRIAAAVRGEGGLHAPAPLYTLVSYGLEGHAGVGVALSQHQAAYTAARVQARRESQGFADAEWWRQVRGAVGKRLHASGGAFMTGCLCAAGPPPGGEHMDFSLPPAAPSTSPTGGGGSSPDLGILLSSGISLSLQAHAEARGVPDYDDVREELSAVGLDQQQRHDRAREIARSLADLDEDELLPWRDLFKSLADLTHTDFKTIVRAERDRRAAAERARRQAIVEQQRAMGDGRPELPHRAAPAPVARALDEQFRTAGVHLRFWRGDWYRWHGTHYRVVTPATIRTMIYTSTEQAIYQDDRDGPVAWNPDTASVNKVIDALAHTVAYRDDLADEDRCIAVANGVLDHATGVLSPHDPARFNLWSLPYAYDPRAACPQWLAFLDQVMPDPENRRLLQEWFGYMVSGRTDLQKILSLFGAPRSGKGTVLRVLVAIVGQDNRATVTLGQLASTFGRQALIGRTMAQVTDANWNIRDVQTAVEALLSISGEDDQGIDRKNHPTWEGRLGVRFVLAANPMPKFNDPSGALLARMLHIEFTRSFAGHEDEMLTPRLLTELPGILNWSLGGLRLLELSGKLTVPHASREAAEEIERTTSPVASWLRDRTTYVDPAACVGIYLDELYQAYGQYCVGAGVQRVASRDVFARDLRAASGGRAVSKRVWLERNTPNARLASMVFGLVLNDPIREGFSLPA